MEKDIKIDYQEMSPFTIREISQQMEVSYRQIDMREFVFIDGLSQSQKFHQIKLIEEQSKQLTGQLKKTVVIDSDQLSLQSDMFLLILIYDNQNQEQVENYLDNIQQQMFGLENHFKQYNIFILINNKDENKLKIKENQYYDGKFIIFLCQIVKLFINYQLGKNNVQLFIMNKQQDKISLLNLIYLGLARHFSPKYLLVQELSYKISNLNHYFNNITQNVTTIVPEKVYKGKQFSSNYLFYQYVLYHNYFLTIQNKKNTFYYDSFNCFYNYEIAKQFIQQYVSEFSSMTENQDLSNLNLQFCKYVQKNNSNILQINQIEYLDEQISDTQNNQMDGIVYEYYDKKQFMNIPNTQQIIQTGKKSIKFKKQINYLFLQYYQLNNLKLILIVEYFHLSQYLFILITLPYYYMNQQTDNQAIHVFISIIPGFIIVGLTYVLILINLVFNITEPIIINSYGKKINIIICKLYQRFYYHDYFGQNNQILQINQQFNIQKGDLLINVDQEKCQQQKQYDPVINQLMPYIITYPILWIQNKFFNIIITIFNIMYLTLIIYLIAYQIYYYIEIKYQMTILIIILLLIQIILALIKYKQQILRYLFIRAFKFIQINLFDLIIESYIKSNQVEQNLLAFQSFFMQILFNSIMLFLFIVIDFCNHQNGGVYVGILAIQTIKQLYLQFFILNRQNNKPRSIIENSCIDDSQLINKEKINKDLIDHQLKTKAMETTQNYLNASGNLQLDNPQLNYQGNDFQSRFQQDNINKSILIQEIQSEQSYQEPSNNEEKFNQQFKVDESPIKNYNNQDQQKLAQYPNDELIEQLPQDQVQRSKRSTRVIQQQISMDSQISKLKDGMFKQSLD